MSESGDSLLIRTPAKINLFLEVLGRRGDGYHDIRSVVVPVSLYDSLVLERKASGILTEMVYLPDYPSNGGREAVLSGNNLTSLAALELKKEAGIGDGLLIRLEKRIPVGGGLGGGSADAAGVLCGLNELWELDWEPEKLACVAGRVGCDVPALVLGGPVKAEGKGEIVSRISLNGSGMEGLFIVLVNPGFGVSTADIYKRCSPSLTSRDDMFNNTISALERRDIGGIAENLFNGLQEAVCRKYPLLGILCEKLKEVGAEGVLVSGSGASVFGLARDEEHAREVQAGLNEVLDYPVWSDVLKLLPDGVMVAHGPLEARV